VRFKDSHSGLRWAERLILLFALSIFLIIFKTNIPSGDGLAYVRMINSGVLDWNPNHLLMAPAGLLWHRAMSLLGITQSPIVSLKLLSGVAAVLSILIFHFILTNMQVKKTTTRLAGCLGLFFSTNFLSLAVSEEFFMIQMPLLLVVLWIGLSWQAEPLERTPTFRQVVAAGALLGLAVLVISNNAFLLASLCLFLLLCRRSKAAALRDAVVLGGSAAAVILPSLWLGYRASVGDEGGFVRWLTSYQGVSGNLIGSLYGIEWTAKGVLESAARLAYNIFANIAEPAGVGTVLKGLLFSDTLEFKPDYINLVLGTLLLMVVAALALCLAWLVIRGGGALARFGSFWVGGYLIFNFLWNDSSNQFWIQILPVLWIWLIVFPRRGGPPSDGACGRYTKRALFLLVPLLVVFNTMHVVAPIALVDVDGLRREHAAIFKQGDLEIIPGWDELHWLSKPEDDGDWDQLRLMTLALEGERSSIRIEQLPTLIRSYMRRGQDVFITRLYDLDGNPRPWDQLRKLGWPREKLRDLLQDFETEEAIQVGGITVRKLRYVVEPSREDIPR
jgi:hypothetical protein